MIEFIVSALVLVGAGFTLVGSLGLVRLQDFYTRLHSPTKATTLGVGSLLIASSIFFSNQGTGLSLHEVLIAAFLFMTAPIGAHLMAKAALHLRVESLAKLPAESLLDAHASAPDSQPLDDAQRAHEDPAKG